MWVCNHINYADSSQVALGDVILWSIYSHTAELGTFAAV